MYLTMPARVLLGFAGLALLVSVAAAAQDDADPQAAAVALHAQALQLLASQNARPLLYVAAPALKPELRLIEIFIDRVRVSSYQFSEPEAAALRQDLRQRLALPNLDAGRHTLRIHVVAREPDSQNPRAAVDEVLEQSLPLDNSTVLELRLGDAGRFGDTPLQLRVLAQAGAREQAQQDYAAFLEASGQGFEAASQRRLSQLPTAAAPLPAESVAEPLVLRYQQALLALPEADAVAQAKLESLAQAPAQGELALTLRDQLNLQLAWRDLRRGQGAKAIERLQRIRSPGPCDNAALLALGWAYLLPAVAREASMPEAVQSSLRPGDADAIAQARRLTPFRYRQAQALGERGEDIRRALVPWEELIGRDALDPAVQEGMLALPYALDHAGAHQQAEQYYQRAIEQLQALRGRLLAGNEQLRSGEWLQLLDARDADAQSGWSRLLVDRRADREVLPLRLLRRDAALAASLQGHRELAAARRALQQDAAALAALASAEAAALLDPITALETQLHARQREQDARIMDLAQVCLQRLDAQAQQYLAEAHFALARGNDQLPGAPQFGAAP